MRTPQFVQTTTPTPAMPPAVPPSPVPQVQQMPDPAPPVPQIASPDPMQQMMLQTMQTILGRLDALESNSQQRHTVPPKEEAISWGNEQQRMAAEARWIAEQEKAPQEEMEVRDKPSPEKWMDTHLFGLQFLQPVPQKPTIKVVFDLGRGGQHLKRFHHAEITKDLVVLIYDDRYEGDRFHPPSTVPGERIQVIFPDKDNQTFDVIVPPQPRLSFTLGCMDVLQLVIAPPSKQLVDDAELTDAELERRSQEIPTRWREPDLEHAIRAGFFDAGAAS